MPGNVIINNGGVLFNYVEITQTGTPSGVINKAYFDANPNQFYKTREIDYADITLIGDDTNSYNEYMFEITYKSTNPRLKITSTTDLYWPEEITVKDGFRYQISILNGVALWIEVEG